MKALDLGEEGQLSDNAKWFTILETILLSVAILVGVFGNLLTTVTVLTSKQIRTVPNAYVVSLAISNLFVSGIAAPYFVATLWSTRNTQEEIRGCAVMAYVTFVLFTVTLYNHAAISLNRYVMVTKTKKTYMNLYKSWKVSISIVSLWLTPSLLFSIPFFGIGTYGYDAHREMCFFEEDGYHEKTYWYIISTDIVGPVIIFLITMVCHLKIMHHFQKSRQRVNQRSKGTVDENSAGGSSNTGLYQHYPYMGSTGQLTVPNCGSMGGLNTYSNLVTKQKKEKHTTSIVKNLVLPWLFLLLLRLPLVIIHIVDHHNKISSFYHHLGLCLVFVNPSIDFVIYALLNRQLRQHLKVFLKCRNPNSIKYTPH